MRFSEIVPRNRPLKRGVFLIFGIVFYGVVLVAVVSVVVAVSVVGGVEVASLVTTLNGASTITVLVLVAVPKELVAT